MGASTVKYMEKMLWYTKTINFLVKCLKVVAKRLNWMCFHCTLYCFIRHSNIEYQYKIFKTYH